jgi:hypothetical protein
MKKRMINAHEAKELYNNARSNYRTKELVKSRRHIDENKEQWCDAIKQTAAAGEERSIMIEAPKGLDEVIWISQMESFFMGLGYTPQTMRNTYALGEPLMFFRVSW